MKTRIAPIEDRIIQRLKEARGLDTRQAWNEFNKMRFQSNMKYITIKN